MPNPSGKINPIELAICGRVKRFRESIKWSQPDFADHIGVKLDQLASIEYGRTPLRYEVAYRIYTQFELPLEYLASGKIGALFSKFPYFPFPENTGLPKNALLSDVCRRNADRYKKASHFGLDANLGEKIKLDASKIRLRAGVAAKIKLWIEKWMARVPDNKISEFALAIDGAAESFLKQYPGDGAETEQARSTALAIEFINWKAGLWFATSVNPELMDLTNATSSANVQGVKGEWPKLKKRIQQATSDSGSKSMLAKFLGVDLTQLSKWLTDSDSAREPGAEYTLQMQAWVTDPKRQK
ncbi:MAG TPA: helix-turn-helix transcriptional regulator [Candidatus Acidoferrales bacterium]|nr:helix-turn-helix transcriptional regulator [Candidatus Acidoferrales bacterium]